MRGAPLLLSYLLTKPRLGASEREGLHPGYPLHPGFSKSLTRGDPGEDGIIGSKGPRDNNNGHYATTLKPNKLGL